MHSMRFKYYKLEIVHQLRHTHWDTPIQVKCQVLIKYCVELDVYIIMILKIRNAYYIKLHEIPWNSMKFHLIYDIPFDFQMKENLVVNSTMNLIIWFPYVLYWIVSVVFFKGKKKNLNKNWNEIEINRDTKMNTWKCWLFLLFCWFNCSLPMEVSRA